MVDRVGLLAQEGKAMTYKAPLTPHQIDMIWRSTPHAHAPLGRVVQVAGDTEAADCSCGARLTRRYFSAGGTDYMTGWSAR